MTWPTVIVPPGSGRLLINDEDGVPGSTPGRGPPRAVGRRCLVNVMKATSR